MSWWERQFKKALQGDIELEGDLIFNTSGGGLCYGDMSVKDNATTTTLNSSGKVQVTIFNTDGPSNNATPDHTNDHITIVKAGFYLVIVSISVANNAAQNHDINVGLFKNNGATQFTNIHAHRTLTGGSGDKGSISLSGIIDTAVDDTIEVWTNTDTAADRIVTFGDVTLSIVQVGGT